MPRTVDYPHGSLKRALILADTVEDLGGSASLEITATQMGKKVGGAFKYLVSAASKYGLIENKRGQLKTTDLYRNYKLAYSEEEQRGVLREAFLRVPVYEELYDRFKGKKLPVEIFEKMLIKEFDVDEGLASRVAGYFVDAARTTALLDDDDRLLDFNSSETNDNEREDEERSGKPPSGDSAAGSATTVAMESSDSHYTVRLRGPGMDSTIRLQEEDDLDILDAMLQKVRRKLQEMAKDDE